MFDLLYKYFCIHQSVAIQGVGVLNMKRTPPQVDIENNLILPPQYQVIFESENEIEVQNDFVNFISIHDNVERAVAKEKTIAFFDTIKLSLEEGRKVHFSGLGLLWKNGESNLHWNAEFHTNHLFQPVDALPESINEDDNTTAVTDEEVLNEKATTGKWWIVALIIALLSIGAIITYYIQNGTLR